MNEQLTKMAESSGDVQRLTALTLIGKMITAESGRIELAPSADASLSERLGYTPGVLDGQIGYRLDAAASSVKVNIFNDQKVLVASIEAPASAAGDHFVQWDGKGFSGNLLPAGDYTVEISASNPTAGEDAETVTASAIVKGMVLGVELGALGTELTTSAGSIPQSAVSNIDLVSM
jgi:flagellar basal-body rod modification protein FlgD